MPRPKSVIAQRTSDKPRLLDAFCCLGGTSMGYARAGFDVVGVDLFRSIVGGYDRKHYPFTAYQADAVSFIEKHGKHFDVIAASPPCQHASAGTRSIRANTATEYPQLIPATRQAIQSTGKPYVIENVRAAELINPLVLCGCMFDMQAVDDDGITLHLQRERRFESSFTLSAPRSCDHSRHAWVGGSYGGARRDKYEARYERRGGYVPPFHVQQKLLGIDWMPERGMYQAVPPIYTEWIGKQIMKRM